MTVHDFIEARRADQCGEGKPIRCGLCVWRFPAARLLFDQEDPESGICTRHAPTEPKGTWIVGRFFCAEFEPLEVG